jgi:hypothetical protein
MGFFSKIWKGVKNVFGGILKIFEPILKPLGKLLNSSLGKAIMIGLSIFTLGSAMVAGYGAFTAAQAAGQGFISAFVEGGKVFLSTLTGMGGKEGATGATAADPGVIDAAQVSQATTEASNLAVQAGGSPELVGQAGQAAEAASAATQGGRLAQAEAATQAATSAGQGAGAVQGTGGMGGMPNLPAGAGDEAAMAALKTGSGGVQNAVEATGWLEKAKNAGKAFGEFAKSEGGGQIVGSLIQGAGNYYTEKDRQEFEDRIRRQWGMGTKDAGIRNIRDASARVGQMPIPSAQDIARTSRTTAQEAGGRPYFERSYGATAGAGG